MTSGSAPARATAALLVLAASLAAGPGGLAAQSGVGTTNVSVQIDLPPITGTGIQSLDFGTLAIGGLADVPPGAAAVGATTSSAGWRFDGVLRKRTLLWDLDLPSALTRGAASIPVDWDNPGYGTICYEQPAGTCSANELFNPQEVASGGTLTTPSGGGQTYDLIIYAGARVSVPVVPPGIYSATVTLTMSYLN